jgi:hypothetical protein
MQVEQAKEMKRCSVCSEHILAVAKKCRYCGAYLDPALKAEALRASGFDAWVSNEGRPPSAIAAGYLGLFSVLPLFGIAAIMTSIIALRKLKREPYLLGKGRAYFGLIMGVGFTVLYAIPLGALLLQAVGVLPK